MLANVVFFARASGNAMHERGAVVSDGSKAILVHRAQKSSGCDLPFPPLPRRNGATCVEHHIELLRFFHFETVDKFTAISKKSSNAQVKPRPHQLDLPVELSRNDARSDQETAARILSAVNHSTRVQDRRRLRRGGTSSSRLQLIVLAIAQATANQVRCIDCTASQTIFLIRTFLLCVSQCPKFDSQTAMRYRVNYSLYCVNQTRRC